MRENHKTTSWPIVAVLVVVGLLLVPLTCYVVGYFALGQRWEVLTLDGPRKTYLRAYGTGWQAQIYWPAAKIESFLTGNQVESILRDH